jgi:AcrR family transcriptional regulator
MHVNEKPGTRSPVAAKHRSGSWKGGSDVSTAVAPEAIRRGTRTRADALRNRERIVAAATQTIVEHGPDVPLDEIARRAGIGNATLYRHFADRQALLREVLLSVVTRTARHAEEAAEQEADPFAALRRFAHAAVDERAGALCRTLITAKEERDAPELTAAFERFIAAVLRLMERAREAGQLREDITFNDLMLAIAQLARPLPGVGCQSFDVHRHLQLFLDGLRAPAPSRGPVPAAGPGPGLSAGPGPVTTQTTDTD